MSRPRITDHAPCPPPRLGLLCILGVLILVGALAVAPPTVAVGSSIHAWGSNAYGQLGNGATTSSNLPVAVGSVSSVTAISAGVRHSVALLSDGSVMAWGLNTKGQLGNGTNTTSHLPVAVRGLTAVKKISAGYFHTLARP